MTESPDPAFCVRNLGSVRRGRFVHKPFTIFCGPNNTGKTWTLYSLYHFWSQLMTELEEIDTELEEIDTETFNKALSASLPDLFNSNPAALKDARFDLVSAAASVQSAPPTEPTDILAAAAKPADIFLMPAERNGLHLFFRELSTRRTALLHHASRENIDIVALLRDVIRSRYAVPIAHYIDWLNNMAEAQKSKSDGFHRHAERLKKDLAGGVYRVAPRSGDISFKPYQRRRDGVGTPELGLHMTSSTVKSLFGLWFYLEHQACSGALLMIDEPELNIHPENQRKIARLMARLVNGGLRIVISTHSDYIIREINSLLMLSRDDDGALRKKHGYEDEELLKPETVGAYLFDDHKIEPFDIDPEDGISATTFDDVIEKINRVNDDIFYSLKERREAIDD